MSQVSDNVESLSSRAKQLRELLSTFNVSESDSTSVEAAV